MAPSLTFLFEVSEKDIAACLATISRALVLLAIYDLTTGHELGWSEVQQWPAAWAA